MQRLHKLVAILSLAIAIIATATATTFAKSNAAVPRTLSGHILKIDRAERTLLVREFGTHQVYKIQVPAGQTLRTNLQSNARAHFEQTVVGMMILDISVR